MTRSNIQIYIQSEPLLCPLILNAVKTLPQLWALSHRQGDIIDVLSAHVNPS